MIEIEVLQRASTIQLKSFNFALAYQLKAVADQKFGDLYKIAKNNLGYRPVMFGLNRWWKKMMGNRVDTNYLFAYGLLRSLENIPKSLWYQTRSYQSQLRCDFHDQIVDRVWTDMTISMKLAVSRYTEPVRQIATKFWDDEDQGVLPILADALEDQSAYFEAAHLRSGFHSPACPVVLRILRGVV